MSPLRVGLAVSATLAAAFAGVEALLGRLASLGSNEVRATDFQLALGLIALVGYQLGAFAAAVRGAERTWRELAPAFVRRADAQTAGATVAGRHESWKLRRLGAIGAGVALMLPLATNGTIETWFLPQLEPEAIAHRLLLIPLGWAVFRFSAVIVSESRRLAALGEGALHVDLLDLRPLAPLARAGLRHALLVAGAVSILLIAFRDSRTAPGLPVVITLITASNLVLSALTLWLALRGGHAAIAREKERANALADTAIRALRTPGAQHAAGALADAVAWKRFVAHAPDWPIDLPALRRFVLPLALPLASLLAGSFLEAAFSRLIPG